MEVREQPDALTENHFVESSAVCSVLKDTGFMKKSSAGREPAREDAVDNENSQKAEDGTFAFSDLHVSISLTFHPSKAVVVLVILFNSQARNVPHLQSIISQYL